MSNKLKVGDYLYIVWESLGYNSYYTVNKINECKYKHVNCGSSSICPGLIILNNSTTECCLFINSKPIFTIINTIKQEEINIFNII